MSDIDTAAADSLKVLDPKRPIREADIGRHLSALVRRDAAERKSRPRIAVPAQKKLKF